MDAAAEENSSRGEIRALLQPPQIIIDLVNGGRHSKDVSRESSVHGSRSSVNEKNSCVIATLRRPSATIVNAIVSHTKFPKSQGGCVKDMENGEYMGKHSGLQGTDSLTTVLSALYGKLLVVLGIAFPITEIISHKARPFFYQGFYLYLYLGSILFVCFVHSSLFERETWLSMFRRNKVYIEGVPTDEQNPRVRHQRYGSHYLRLGAIAFGMGNMVYSGLEFGRYFEVRSHRNCNTIVTQATTPALKMIITIIQIQFIFLNNMDFKHFVHKAISKFGLMHMLASNICEWLHILVQETHHEIEHLLEKSNATSTHTGRRCDGNQVMSSLLSNASPFLFPCIIEYSLICAVILYEMWKRVQEADNVNGTAVDEVGSDYDHYFNSEFPVQSDGHSDDSFTVDCSSAQKGLFAGIIVMVLTIISLTMFFVMAHDKKISSRNAAASEVNVVELVLYTSMALSIICARIEMKDMKYERINSGVDGAPGMGLDNILLVVAQTGVFIYSIFSIIGSFGNLHLTSPIRVVSEILALLQSSMQTMFVLDCGKRKCRTWPELRTKPGREFITFLIIANMAVWSISALEKNRAEFKPTHLEFFGEWTWIIITHVSMPLAIFYRFHSTICLYEMWRRAYKVKKPLNLILNALINK